MPSQTTAASPTVEGCICAYARAEEMVEIYERSGGDYSAVGPHLRHCLDHAVCLFRGLESGIVDYDRRDRDPDVETDVAAFRAASANVIAMLSQLNSKTLARNVVVRQIPAPNYEAVTTPTTVERELLFLSGHVIHHLAIIGEIARQRGIEISPELCMAYSTAAHRNGADA